jgi:glyoxylase-like metal-dependent hydrolase (beta-lactamase superfamily II)
VTVVDCGFPGYYDQLPAALTRLGRSLDAVGAVILTHHHPDHVGAAERIRAETGATVYVPMGDAEGVRRGRVEPPPGMLRSLWRPRMMRYMAHAAGNGAGRGNHVHLSDGRITRWDGYFDHERALADLGLAPEATTADS